MMRRKTAIIEVKPPPPPTSLGPHIGDPQELVQRLQKKWNGQATLEALKFKIKDYEERYGIPEDKNKNADKEMAILQKVVEEGEGISNLQNSEKATLHQITHGFRDYVDFALDELSRHARVVNNFGGGPKEFVWRKQGEAADNPCLRRSHEVNAVFDDMSRVTKHPTRVEYAEDALDLRKNVWWDPSSASQESKPSVGIRRRKDGLKVDQFGTGPSVEGRFSVL